MKFPFIKHIIPNVSNKYYLFLQDRWARRMSSATKGLSRNSLISLLILFVILSTGFFICNIYIALSKHNSQLEIATISKPEIGEK